MQNLDDKTARLRAARLARDEGRPKVDREAHHRVLGLRDPMPFGKHRGKSLEDVIDEDIAYLTWLMENTRVELSLEAEDLYYTATDPRRPARRRR